MSTCSKSVSNSSTEDDNELRRGPWTAEEDTLLVQYIANHGEGRWNLLAKCSGLRRTGKSCRLRWLNYLKPDVKRGNFTPEEQILILELHSKWGNRWSKIAKHLPGRTDNEIKNYWRTRIQKQARHLRIDTDSAQFREIVRRFWMPRLLQKVKGTSSSAASLQNKTIPLPQESVSQYSIIDTATPHPWQQEAHMNKIFVSFTHHEQNSDSDYNNNSCISSLESTNIQKIPQFPISTNSQFPYSGNSDLSNFLYDGCFVNNSAYEIETFNLANATAAGNMEYPFVDCQMAESNWVNNDFARGWNIDELWQFRNLQK